MLRIPTKSLERIGRNARVSIYIQPLWAIPFFMLSAYSTLYMTGQGIGEREVGLINSAAFIIKAAVAIFAGYVVNLLGRRKSIIIFDLISIVTPYVILTFASNFWEFMAAYILTGFGVINTIAQHCYLVEDVLPEDRVITYGFLETIYILAAFFSPVTGFLVAKHAMVPVIRGIYAFAAICAFVFVLMKLLYMSETTIGMQKANSTTAMSIGDIFKNMWKTVLYTVNKRQLAKFIIINTALSFASTLNTIYFFLYLTQRLNYSVADISVFPFITSVVALITMLLIIRINKLKDVTMEASLLIYVIGAIFLVAAPPQHSLVFVLVNVICYAVSLQITSTVLQAKIANAVEDTIRADVLGFSNVFSMLALFPTGIVGGLLYKASPVSLFYTILFIYTICFILYVSGQFKDKFIKKRELD